MMPTKFDTQSYLLPPVPPRQNPPSKSFSPEAEQLPKLFPASRHDSSPSEYFVLDSEP